MNIIFLDFDGVLDTASYDMYLVRHGLSECDENGRPVFDPKCIENLKEVIDATNADIVVTSDWKDIDTYDDLLEMWRYRDMPGFMTDLTPNINKHRGDEIARWLDECDVNCNYVIIDDLGPENFNKEQIDKLVTVNPYYGLDKEAAIKAISIINSYSKNKRDTT